MLAKYDAVIEKLYGPQSSLAVDLFTPLNVAIAQARLTDEWASPDDYAGLLAALSAALSSGERGPHTLTP